MPHSKHSDKCIVTGAQFSLVERCFWEAEAARSSRVAPICIHITTMHVYSVEYWQKNWDELMERVEKGENIGVTNGKETAIMMPADDEIIRIYRDLNNEAS